MNIPHKCPVCKGKGEIRAKKAKHEAKPLYTTSKGKNIYSCHACLGAL